ncbi:hypothetical protein LMANV2_170005 [Leptospira interrogans serovar Manilae]|uniref:Uncharacterized protein n=1 Tax=Leptospira interrogans serovar Manilae TaxID=214675 RepID=A0AAQ1NVE6_LEPIR|nr:hypothetical protein LMANV2_170005 [Leptospira interrogans serovar Manilae]
MQNYKIESPVFCAKTKLYSVSQNLIILYQKDYAAVTQQNAFWVLSPSSDS